MQGLSQAALLQRHHKKGLIPIIWNADAEPESSCSVPIVDGWKESKRRDEVQDEDTVSLESLVSHPTSKERISIYDAVDDMLHLSDILQKSGRDPLMDLNEYYQKQGIPGIKSNFREEKVICHRKQPPCWRIIFECPCTGERVSCCIPIIFYFDNDRPQESPVPESISNNFLLGLRMHQGSPCWYQKALARRTTAIAMLLHLGFYGEDFKTPVVASSLHEAKQMLCPLENTEQDRTGDNPVNSESREDKFPAWVDALYDMGVQTVEISYHEDVRSARVVDYTLQHQILLACRLLIKTPWSADVTGEVAPTKNQALQSAIQVLLQNHGQKHLQARMNKPNCEKTKRRLLMSDSSFAKFIQPIPEWACATFSGSSHETCYLYELVLENQAGNSFVSEHMGMNANDTTRVGILFPVDISAHLPYHEHLSHFVSSFIFNHPSTCKDELVRTALCHRTVVQPWRSASNDAAQSLTVLKEFNRRLMAWKQYGFVPHAPRWCDTAIQDKPHRIGRTYLIVPLTKKHLHDVGFDEQKLSIDWELIIKECFEYPSRFLKRTFRVWQVPVLGGIDAVSVAWIALFSAGAFLSQGARNGAVSQASWLSFESFIEVFVATVFVLVALVSFLSFLLPPVRCIPNESLEKWFVLHRSQLYILQNNMDNKVTAFSPFPPPTRPTKKRSYKSFNEYYRVRYGLEIKYPGEKLLTAIKVDKHTDHNPFLRAQLPVQKVLLIPEFTRILPVPRDFLYAVGLANSALPPMERVISMSMYSAGIQRQSHLLKSYNLSQLACRHRQLSSALNIATTSYPKATYERLEFLGDAVLGYFLAIKAFSLSHSLDWHLDELENAISNAGRNDVLAEAALRVGVPKLLHASKTHWQSAYSDSNAENAHQLVDLPDTILSDCVESCLGAMYVSSGPCIVDDLLKSLRLPLFSEISTIDTATCCCIVNGFDLKTHSQWTIQLEKIHEEIYHIPPLRQKLSFGVEHLCNTLGINAFHSIDSRFETSFKPLLLGCAICNYNPDIGDTMETNVSGFVVPHELVSMLSHFREILYQVGAFSLQLKISEEIFSMYDEADPNDLHFLRTAAITDDVSAYIFTNFKLHQALLVQNHPAFETIVQVANMEGRDFWKSKDGWFLPGGLSEFQRRVNQHFNESNCNKLPRYPGLLAGRLFGHDRKLDMNFTKSLVFSFKAVIGALVLAMGMESMWTIIRPLYHELILMSAEELRDIAPGSTLVRSYTKSFRTK